MGPKYAWCIFAVATLWVARVCGSYNDEIARISTQCCSVGTGYARQHTHRDCKSAAPPPLVPPQFGDLCTLIVSQCCFTYFDKKKDCDAGVQAAEEGRGCDAVGSDTGKNCCSSCLQGKEKAGQCSASSQINSDDDLLSDVFDKCCQNASSAQTPAKDSQPPISGKPLPLSTDIDMTSVCEEYAPNELCAHHCIPVPGSYRCECNPGYKLMADGRNCVEVVKNRCKPRSPCQHKCNDNGFEVKCSCRRGYELQPDGKSCKDIDECASATPACAEDMQCRNTQGSYKCLPTRRSSVHLGKCPPGFTKNLTNGACDDIDECALPRPPCPPYLCQNTAGGYRCGGAWGEAAPPAPAVPAAPLTPRDDRCPPGFRAGYGDDCEDVDECKMHKDDCNPLSQFCINIRGSFYCQDRASKHCPPGFKINAATSRCEDIDECLESDFHCPSDKVCVNVPGAYDCKAKAVGSRSKCPEGTRMNPGSTVCEDIDECLEGTHMCDQHQSCVNTKGSHECLCKPGYKLDTTVNACVDINECATEENDCIPDSQRCDNTVGSYICVRLVSCGTGYILHHSTSKCEDMDECELGTHNCARAGPEFECVNIPGSFRCVHKTSSTTASPDYEYYYDSEELDDNLTLPAVSSSTSTTSTTTSSTTTTSTTTTTTTTTPQPPPQDITPTATSSTRPTERLAKPEVTPPTIQEVVPNNQDQYNTGDTYFVPNTNSRFDDEIIQIPDEKDAILPPEGDNNETPELQKPVSSTTEKIDEANVSTKPKLVFVEPPKDLVPVKGVVKEDGSVVVDVNNLPKSTWTELQPSQTCPLGFEPDESGVCVDIDECTTDRHGCSILTEVCHNNIGGHICECADGYRRDLITRVCDLIVTTTPKPATTPTSVPVVATEKNEWWNGSPSGRVPVRAFRPRNMCDIGYHMNSETKQCEDINECMNGVAKCAAVEICINTEGGYRCECPPYWRFDDKRLRCVPIRAKSVFPFGYANLPGNDKRNNTTTKDATTNVIVGTKYGPPSTIDTQFYGKKECPRGYEYNDDDICEDIDECAIGTANCGPAQTCSNTPGGYSCRCPAGFTAAGARDCLDVDECTLNVGVPICSQHADCINTVGSFHCKCHKGFRTAPSNDKVCMDVDECTESRQGTLCEQRCNNVWGSYRCSCYKGYKLNADNRTCSDIDECSMYGETRVCAGRCVNMAGSYRCECPSGYRLSDDKRSCIDIDECETGEAPCASSKLTSSVGGGDICVNTRGSFRCEKITCLPGYRFENKHRCTKEQQLCSATDWECLHQTSTYSYNYITFVSNLYIPSKVDLFTMRGPPWPNAQLKFQLKLVAVDAPPTVKKKANIDSFLLTPTTKHAVVSIVESLQGPQSIELELSMELFSDDRFAGSAVAKLIIFVSEFDF